MTRNWSAEQMAIFEWFQHGRGNLVVRARAGTGKTTTILEGINFAPEGKILLAAFNRDIAKEIQSKLQNPRAEAKTLHSLGFAFVRRNWNVKVDDDATRAEGLVKAAAPEAPPPIVRVIKNLHTKARDIDPFLLDLVKPCAHDKTIAGRETCPACLLPAMQRMEDIAVNYDCMPDEEWEAEGWGISSVCEAAVQAMVLAKAKTDLIDFADMIFLPIVHRWVRPWFEMVVVDEAQDMTVAQLALAMGACKRNGRIAVVGDNRQAIYGFRGADSNSLDRLKTELHAPELGLTTTYRCPRLVVELAAKIVRDYKAAPQAPEGEIQRIENDAMLAVAKEGDFILSRTNAPLVKICMTLLKAGKRARIKGRDVGKGLIAVIRRLRPRDLQDLTSKLGQWVEKETERARERLREEAAEARIEFVCDQRDIVLALMDGATTIRDLETRLETLFSEDAGKQSVMLSTVHRAKGLETERVFLLEGTFRQGKQEEENISYVAITRAKSTLVWVTGFEKAKKAEEEF